MQVNHKPFHFRFLSYLHQRFPVIPLSLFVLVTTTSLQSLTGQKNIPAILASAILYLLFLFHLRLLDEFKDARYDNIHHPERPVPQGLISFAELKRLVRANSVIMITISFLSFPPSLIFLFLTLLYTFFMFKEFWQKNFWQKSPLLYLISHELVFIPLYLLFFSITFSQLQPPSLFQTLALAYLILPVILIEIGRKIPHRYGRDGKPTSDTYAYLWGQVRTIQIFAGLIIVGGALAWLIPDRFVLSPFILWAGGGFLLFSAARKTKFLVRYSLALTTIAALVMPLLIIGPLP